MSKPRPEPMVAVGLDVGGTSVKSGTVDAVGAVHDNAVTPIDADGSAADLAASLAAVIDNHLGTHQGLPVAVAFPGPFDYAIGVPRLRHKFAALADVALGPRLEAACAHAVGTIRFVNDAEAAAIGEVRHLGPDAPGTVLVVSLGTGLGTGLVEGGLPVRWRAGLEIAELWARPVSPQLDGDHRSTAPVTADDVFSASGLARRLGVERDGLPTALRAPDADTTGVVAAWAGELGAFIDEVVDATEAELVVVAGGLSAAYRLYGEPLGAEVRVPVIASSAPTTVAVLGAVAACHPHLLTDVAST